MKPVDASSCVRSREGWMSEIKDRRTHADTRDDASDDHHRPRVRVAIGRGLEDSADGHPDGAERDRFATAEALANGEARDRAEEAADWEGRKERERAEGESRERVGREEQGKGKEREEWRQA